jgi:alkylation response protein AidB-like acyl-CoA dehydrogenase
MHPLVDNALGLAGELASHRADHDGTRRLTDAVVDLIRDAGFLGSLLPRELGGVQMAPAPYLEVLEALATGDSATAWVVMTATTTTLLAPYLARPVAEDVFSDPLPLMAGVLAPAGKLRDGRLAGRWAYASGSKHADWFALGATTDEATPRAMICFVPAAQVVVMENWDTLGLAGTGSHDVVVDLAQPSKLVTSLDRAPWSDAPLYRMPVFGLLAAAVAAVALGTAKTALAAASKGLTSPRAEVSTTALVAWAELRAQLDAARAYLLDAVDRAFAQAAKPATAATRGELRLAAGYAAARCADVGRGAFHLAGGVAIRSGHPLGAALRDLEVMLTHRMVADRVRPAAARAMLGLGAPPADL